MTDPASHLEPDLPLTRTERIDALCLAFEDAWQRGEAPEVSDWLARIDPDARGPLLMELIVLDVTYRRLRGQDCDAARYTEAHPEHRERIEAAFDQLECLDAVSDLTSGTELGRYTIEDKLGSGGFATVYRAFDQELQRRVAIKAVRRDREATDADFQRLMEEARTVARLSHPGIVPVYDVLRSDDGVCIVMEHIAGPSLKETLSAGPLPPQRAAELAAALCDALSHAHRSGFVHRDLKPSNILLDEAGHPHIADFGLAVHDSNVPGLRGQRAGSAAYMAPEQIDGEADRLDGRADIWAVGVLLYEMLSGRRPFEGQTPEHLRSAIQSREPKPLRQIDPAIPSTLAAICTRCLNKRPADRYATAADIAAELRAELTEGVPPAARAVLPALGFRGGAVLGMGLGLLLLLAVWLVAPELIWPRNNSPADARIQHQGDDLEAIRDKLEAIAYAFHFHHDAFGMFTQPLAGKGTPQGSRLSWRVHLLPYLDQQPLYERFRLDEPWDSAHNLQLLNQMPDAYRVAPTDNSLTRFRVFTGPQALFGPGHRPRLADLRDGASNTILAVAVGPDRTVEWTRPEGMTLDSARPFSALGTLPHQSLECVMADLSLLSLPQEVAASELAGLITPSGGEVTGGETLRRTHGPEREPRRQDVRDVLDRRRQSMEKLKRIVLAMHNFHDTHKQFPPQRSAAYFDAQGRPNLSWRVHLLPFLEEEPLYRRFKLDEPWNSSHNLPLQKLMPDVYRDWDDPPDSPETRIMVLTGPHTAYLTAEGPRLRDFADGPSNTILVLRAGRDRAAPWTKPQDVAFEPTAPVACLGKFGEPGFAFATADGAVRRLKTSVPADLFLPLVTPAGNETPSSELRDYGFR